MSDEASAEDDIYAIEFHRHLDGLTYRFERAGERDGKAKWRRIDLELELHWSERWGWIVSDKAGTLLSRPWDTEKEAQGLLPPGGLWVSRKGSQSYVYDLRRMRAALST